MGSGVSIGFSIEGSGGFPPPFRSQTSGNHSFDSISSDTGTVDHAQLVDQPWNTVGDPSLVVSWRLESSDSCSDSPVSHDLGNVASNILEYSWFSPGLSSYCTFPDRRGGREKPTTKKSLELLPDSSFGIVTILCTILPVAFAPFKI